MSNSIIIIERYLLTNDEKLKFIKWIELRYPNHKWLYDKSLLTKYCMNYPEHKILFYVECFADDISSNNILFNWGSYHDLDYEKILTNNKQEIINWNTILRKEKINKLLNE